jgi:hypothetical protein
MEMRTKEEQDTDLEVESSNAFEKICNQPEHQIKDDGVNGLSGL